MWMGWLDGKERLGRWEREVDELDASWGALSSILICKGFCFFGEVSFVVAAACVSLWQCWRCWQRCMLRWIRRFVAPNGVIPRSDGWYLVWVGSEYYIIDC